MSDLIIKNGLVYDPLNKLDGEKKEDFYLPKINMNSLVCFFSSNK